MTDLEIARLCAESMGYVIVHTSIMDPPPPSVGTVRVAEGKKHNRWYDPLHDDAQAMALVKAWPMPTTAAIRDGIMTHTGRWETFDVNRAICECVAKMRAAKQEVTK